MDDCDLGAKYAAFFREQALNKVRNTGPVGESRIECIDCGDGIPEGRRKAKPGCERCVRCQVDFEGGAHGS